ncbi:hypothetical protein ACT17_06230 [Mycolicibacterium conceptionense]|uniref:Transmembrane protein n=1 Tax=Mycolicibacterium conceptionense TaxID=451644 RepID=A0A0J8UGW3_9MYCO|nr:hypothetical protein [Mycolicibacterium conceptionense]KMV19635.1 hypothetical protein ACT17_06230 [Mycolicibacterium conceptionense]
MGQPAQPTVPFLDVQILRPHRVRARLAGLAAVAGTGGCRVAFLNLSHPVASCAAMSTIITTTDFAVPDTDPVHSPAGFADEVARLALFLSGLAIAGIGFLAVRAADHDALGLFNQLGAGVFALGAVALFATAASQLRRGAHRSYRWVAFTIMSVFTALPLAAAAVHSSAPPALAAVTMAAGSLIAAAGFVATAPVRSVRQLLTITLAIGAACAAALYGPQYVPELVEHVRSRYQS